MRSVWGAGAIGGTLGAHLARAGHDVLFVDRAADHVARINAARPEDHRARAGIHRAGPRGHAGRRARPVRYRAAVRESAGHAKRRRAIIAPHLADDGCIVSVQNGLNERVIAGIVGPARTVGAFVNFGADYMEPGVVQYGGRGAVVVGEIDGRITPTRQAAACYAAAVR